MATAQVVSATTALHDEKIEEKSNVEIREDIKSTNDQETTPQPQEDQPPKEKPLDDITVAPEPDVAAPEVLEAKPEPKAEPEPEAEPEALAAEVETKVVLKEEEEGKDIPVDQPAKVAPEPCVEEEAKETKEPEGEPVETKTETEAEAVPEPTEVAKSEGEPKEEIEKKEEGAAAE
ncbi:hypothetical protein HanPI659440_Chr03g0117261 [Helianthus annuus]|nr:hypothetical protein HanPI659440_Chr03g0117261 [Helianthus annuus]